MGIPIPGVEVRIDEPNEDGIGEILVKGPNVMIGYYKNTELTKSLIHNGWFHTGDRGKFVNKRFLKISGRKKNMFKTTSGRYIVPERIENILMSLHSESSLTHFDMQNNPCINRHFSVMPSQNQLNYPDKKSQN